MLLTVSIFFFRLVALMIWRSSSAISLSIVSWKTLKYLSLLSDQPDQIAYRVCFLWRSYNRWGAFGLIRTNRWNPPHNLFQIFFKSSPVCFSEVPPRCGKWSCSWKRSTQLGMDMLEVKEYFLCWWRSLVVGDNRDQIIVRKMFPFPCNWEEGTTVFELKISWILWDFDHSMRASFIHSFCWYFQSWWCLIKSPMYMGGGLVVFSTCWGQGLWEVYIHC